MNARSLVLGGMLIALACASAAHAGPLPAHAPSHDHSHRHVVGGARSSSTNSHDELERKIETKLAALRNARKQTVEIENTVDKNRHSLLLIKNKIGYNSADAYGKLADMNLNIASKQLDAATKSLSDALLEIKKADFSTAKINSAINDIDKTITATTLTNNTIIDEEGINSIIISELSRGNASLHAEQRSGGGVNIFAASPFLVALICLSTATLIVAILILILFILRAATERSAAGTATSDESTSWGARRTRSKRRRWWRFGKRRSGSGHREEQGRHVAQTANTRPPDSDDRIGGTFEPVVRPPIPADAGPGPTAISDTPRTDEPGLTAEGPGETASPEAEAEADSAAIETGPAADADQSSDRGNIAATQEPETLDAGPNAADVLALPTAPLPSIANPSPGESEPQILLPPPTASAAPPTSEATKECVEEAAEKPLTISDLIAMGRAAASMVIKSEIEMREFRSAIDSCTSPSDLTKKFFSKLQEISRRELTNSYVSLDFREKLLVFIQTCLPDAAPELIWPNPGDPFDATAHEFADARTTGNLRKVKKLVAPGYRAGGAVARALIVAD